MKSGACPIVCVYTREYNTHMTRQEPYFCMRENNNIKSELYCVVHKSPVLPTVQTMYNNLGYNPLQHLSNLITYASPVSSVGRASDF